MRLGDSVSVFFTFQCRWVVSLACHSFLPQTLSNRKHWVICQSLLDSYHFKTLSSWKVSYMSSVENMSWPIFLPTLAMTVSGPQWPAPATCSLCLLLFPSSGHPLPSQDSVSCRAVVPFYPGPMLLTDHGSAPHGGVPTVISWSDSWKDRLSNPW